MTHLRLAVFVLPVCVALCACLERPVVKSEPRTTNVVVRPFPNRAIDKIDLLLVVDNSGSMADKQNILKKAVPKMVERLVLPDCVRRDDERNVVERTRGQAPPSSSPDARPVCPDGLSLEFEPIRDIHIGVITSSLGGHGSGNCSNESGSGNDRAWLLPTTETRTGVPDPHGTGFLVWHPALEPDDAPGTPIEGDLARLTSHLETQIGLVGENGCGFEAPLEAVYRFLIDPAPPKEIVLENVSGSSRSRRDGLDEKILAQRAAFLRPDSLLGILVLTDENDCSILDGDGYYPYSDSGFLLTTPTYQGDKKPPVYLPVATAACEENPNDPCCTTCYATNVPAGCDDPNALASCTGAGQPRLTAELDRDNARCFDGKRRFGVDLLYPVSRYVTGLTESQVYDALRREFVDNPLFAGGRSSDTVFLAGIAGVPWQDLATDATRAEDSAALAFLTADELATSRLENGASRWDLVLGTPGLAADSLDCSNGTNGACGRAPIPPLDPFMVESIDPRSGTNPLTGVGPTLAPIWNSVNGHEYDNAVPSETTRDGLPARDDLQYACIFPLAPYGDLPACGADSQCDCRDEPSKGRPLCRATATSPLEAEQSWAKAYPGTRLVQVLAGIGDSAIVASICPKVHDADAADFGYNPAVRALVDRLAERLEPPCLGRDLSLDEQTGGADCLVVEARGQDEAPLDCTLPGRAVVGANVDAAIRRELGRTGICATEDCADQSLCVIEQLVGDAATECLSTPLGAEKDLAPGYCYVNPALGLGSDQLTASCRAQEKRRLRFVGSDTPQKDTVTLFACTGETVTDE